MRLRVILAALGVATAALAASGCAEMHKSATAKAPAERVANSGQGESLDAIKKLPDWSGVWDPMLFAAPKKGAAPPAPPAPPQLTPPYAKKYVAFQAKAKKMKGIAFVTDAANCVPYGMPTSMREPYPIEFLYTPGRVTVLIETDSTVRRIYTDGRKMPDDPDPTFQGYSIGHWEGDTLVTETTGLRTSTSVINGINGHGEKLFVTERMHLIDPDTLQIETTMTDPDMLTAPYTTTTTYQRHRDWEMMEYVCQDNNRDGVDAKGNPTFNLDRKPGE